MDGFQDDQGFEDRTKHPPFVAERDYTRAELKALATRFINEGIRPIAASLQQASDTYGWGITVSTKKVEMMILDLCDYTAVKDFFDDSGLGGRIFENQIATAAEAFNEIIADPAKSGLILGAMQSSKTGTSLTLQFFGPIFYLMHKVKVYPIYLVTNLTSHEQQTKLEFERFLRFYGDIEFAFDRKLCTIRAFHEDMLRMLPVQKTLNEEFSDRPSLKGYRQSVLHGAVEAYREVNVNDFVRRRVHGRAIRDLVKFVKKMKAMGFWPLIILDESQHGASDRLVDGEPVDCVLRTILVGLEDALGREAPLVCLSATPFDISDLSSFWKVHQRLPANYRGFNMFKGQVIDEYANIDPPNVLNVGEMGARFGVDFLRHLNGALFVQILKGTAKEPTFERWASKANYRFTGNTTRAMAQYARKCTAAIGDMIIGIGRHNGGRAANGKPVGMCVRMTNHNSMTNSFIESIGAFCEDGSRFRPSRFTYEESERLYLNVDGVKVQVLRFFDKTDGSVRTFLHRNWDRQHPFVMFVTNRARMGDSFPAEVEYFFDMSRKASDLNALLQGLLGRACGANKSSTVCLSYENTDLVRDYIHEQGKLRYTPSRHSIRTEGGGRASQVTMLRIPLLSDDPVIRRFFERVDREVVEPNVPKNAITPRGGRRGGVRYVPLIKIIEDMNLFDYLEEEAGRLFPNLMGSFKLARPGDRVPHSRTGVPLQYLMSPTDPGSCKIGFRATDRFGGMSGRGQGKRDSRTDRARTKDILEPQINLVKINPKTGQPFAGNKAAGLRGDFKPYMIALPLLAPARELSGSGSSEALPASDLHAMWGKMTDAEKERAHAARTAREED